MINRIFLYPLYFILSIIAIFMIIPFLWMLSTSLKEPGAVFKYPPQWIPKPVVFRNYVDAWKAVPFGRFFINSIIVAVCVTIGQVFTSSLAAYAFARLRFPGRDTLFLGYLATMMIPGQVTMIPVFILIKKLGWIDTYQALILPSIFSAYGTFMLRQFFLTIPKELEEAAIIDGLNRWQIYWKIILPLSKPALATLSTFVFLGSWNDFMWPLIVTNSMEMKTLPVGLAAFQGLYTTDWNLLMAASTIVLAPVLILYIFNQRFFTRGIVMTGLKG
jgi:multiple sugar transport system permease protein